MNHITLKQRMITLAAVCMMVEINLLNALPADGACSDRYTKNHTVNITNTTNYPITINLKAGHYRCSNQLNPKASHQRTTLTMTPPTMTTSWRYKGVLENITVTNNKDQNKKSSYDKNIKKAKVLKTISIADNGSGIPTITVTS